MVIDDERTVVEEDSLNKASQAPAPEPAMEVGVLPPGFILGSYAVERLLGRGGFGFTYLAKDAHLRHHVAIKEYLPFDYAYRDEDNSIKVKSENLQDRFDWGRKSFLQEAQTLAQFKHPNIVRVLTFFEQNNTAYFVMDYEQGESLSAILEKQGVLNERQLLSLVLPLLDGLEVLHDAGYIHRDIKPANIYVRTNGSPVLLDFGSARRALVEGNEKALTAMLTPGYAPHEQYHTDSEMQGPWTDIYALGGVMYRAMTRQRPTESTKRSSARLTGKPDPLRSLDTLADADYSENFLMAVSKALNLLEHERPQSIAQWRNMLCPPGNDPWADVGLGALANAAREDQDPHMRETPQKPEEAQEVTVELVEEGADTALSPHTGLTVDPPDESKADDYGVDEDLTRHGADLDVLSGFWKHVLVLTSSLEHGKQDSQALRELRPEKVTTLDSGTLALERLKAERVDLILCDGVLHDMRGREFLGLLGRKLPLSAPPVLMVARDRRRHVILDAIAAGAWGYVIRPYEQESFKRTLLRTRELSLFTEIEDALLDSARDLVEAKDYDGAIEALEEVTDLEMEASEYDEMGYDEHNALGYKALLEEHYAKAMSAFAKADKLNRLLAKAYQGLAKSYHLKGDVQQVGVERTFTKQALQRMVRMKTARKLFIDILKYQSHVPSPFNTLGVKLSKREDWDSALQAFELALEAAPEDANIFFNMAKAFLGKGEELAATDALEQSLRLRADFQEARELYGVVTGLPYDAESKGQEADCTDYARGSNSVLDV